MKQQSLNLFDDEISDLINEGDNRKALEHAIKHIIHAIATASGIHSAKLGDRESAVKLMKASLEIQPDNPTLYSNLTCLLCQQERYLEALAYGMNGIALPDATADMWYNYAVVCKNMGKLQDAADAFRKARDLNPEDAMTHCQLANVLLPLGEYEEGLREDEWRFKAHSGLKMCRNRYKQPDWDGKADLNGKKILVFNEQGHGDAIQFSRYIPKLKELGAYVIFEIQPELYKLYLNTSCIDQVISREEGKQEPVIPLPEHDYVVSVGSLPHLFDPCLDHVPMETPYLSPVKPEGETTHIPCDKFQVGVVWAGSQWHTNDKDRSCFLKHFEAISNLPNVELFSLQHGDMERTWPRGKTVLWQGSEDIDVVNLLEGAENVKITDLTDYIGDFNDTAIILQQLDLLLAVDTSIAHLAGALGRPVWLLLPYAHEWRWRVSWYPSMKIFRQPGPGDWAGLLANVSQELAKVSVKSSIAT